MKKFGLITFNFSTKSVDLTKFYVRSWKNYIHKYISQIYSTELNNSEGRSDYYGADLEKIHDMIMGSGFEDIFFVFQRENNHWR